MNKREQNAFVIDMEIAWLHKIIVGRIQAYLDNNSGEYTEPELPDTFNQETAFTNFVKTHSLTTDERKVLLLALAPEIKPEVLDEFLIRNRLFDKIFTEFGGLTTSEFNGFLPTFKTALFTLAGHNVQEQMKCLGLFEKDAPLIAHKILNEQKSRESIPQSSRLLSLSSASLNLILTGEDEHHEYRSGFPARQLNTPMNWDDLILHKTTQEGLKELLAWPDHGRKLIDELGMGKNIKLGYRALFHGPPGTGKTLTAALIGKKVRKPVYRVDLSRLVSKYIGETEKNLEKIFTASENRDWILFFDEADGLFGKRTSITSSNDRFANQETAYLLQRIEESNNIIILATNLKGNLDQAFIRRFQSVIHFPLPTPQERSKIWKNALSDRLALEDSISLDEIVGKYDISGGSIINVIRFASLMTVSKGTTTMNQNDLMEGMRREYAKLGRTL